jgi:hypothetical protein
MSDNTEPRDSGLALHRFLQWTSTILTGLLVAFVVSGMETWDRLKEQSIRNESVPSDIKAIKEDLSDVSDDVANVKWRVTNLETNTKNRK